MCWAGWKCLVCIYSEILGCLRCVCVQLEASGTSFTALLANAPSGDAAYIDSGDILEESKRRAGGMKIRMQHYFKRQA